MLNISVSDFQQFGYYPLFIIFFLNCADIAKDPIIEKASNSNKFPTFGFLTFPGGIEMWD